MLFFYFFESIFKVFVGASDFFDGASFWEVGINDISSVSFEPFESLGSKRLVEWEEGAKRNDVCFPF